MFQSAYQTKKIPCLPELLARLSYELRARNTLCSWTTARAERLALPFLHYQAPIWSNTQFPTPSPVKHHAIPTIKSVSYNGIVIPWPQNFTNLQTSWNATELTRRRSRKRSSARKTPPNKSLSRGCMSGTRLQRHETPPRPWFDGLHLPWHPILCTIQRNH